MKEFDDLMWKHSFKNRKEMATHLENIYNGGEPCDAVQVTYTFTSFDAEEVDKMEKFCKEFIKDGVIVEGVRVYDIDEYKAKCYVKCNVDKEN